jgi:hypothetical protein
VGEPSSERLALVVADQVHSHTSGEALDSTNRRPSQPVSTRATQRLLVLRGLAADEATNLTAFLCGFPVTDRHWQLREINQLLFLRELERQGRFGPRDGQAD